MKTILITGATSGFGLATAEELAKENKLILIGRRAERLEELKKSLGQNVYTAVVDVTDNKQVERFLKELPEEFSSIDVLINNAGLAKGMEPAQNALLSDWEQMVNTNIVGLLRITRLVLDGMVKRNSGLIINIGSVAGALPYKGGNVYGATKAFVRQFSRNLRVDLFGTKIKVTNVEPGAAVTEFAEVRFEDAEKAKAFYSGWEPMRPKDIANTIRWIIEQPPTVNVENIEIMPLDQTYAGLATNKK